MNNDNYFMSVRQDNNIRAPASTDINVDSIYKLYYQYNFIYIENINFKKKVMKNLDIITTIIVNIITIIDKIIELLNIYF